jgi:prepilin-type N-terminal cleavage/methylation domain-containing protein
MFKLLTHNTKSGFTRRGSSGGFTLVELVAVMVILGICLAPIGAMFYTIMAKYAQPEAVQVATALAEGQMERVTGLAFASVVNEGPTAFADFPAYTYQVIVSTLAGQPDMSEYKQVQVRVVNSSLDVSVSLFTIMSIKQAVD